MNPGDNYSTSPEYRRGLVLGFTVIYFFFVLNFFFILGHSQSEENVKRTGN